MLPLEAVTSHVMSTYVVMSWTLDRLSLTRATAIGPPVVIMPAILFPGFYL